jgi:transcriptional regulator with XRE-family HTH domain
MRMNNTFGITIRAARKRMDMSLRRCAELSNIDFTYLSKIERGVFPAPSDVVIRALAQTLDLGYDYLLRLAGRLAPELIGWLLRHPKWVAVIREASDSSA